MTPQDRAALTGAQQELQQMKVKMQRLEAKDMANELAMMLKDLDQEPDGPIFVATEEIDRMMAIPRQKWAGHIQFMRTRYQKKSQQAPNGGSMPVPDEQQADPATLAKIMFQRPPVPGMRTHFQQPQGQQPQVSSSNEEACSVGAEVAKRRARGEHDCTPAKVLMERRAGSNGAVKVR